MKEMAARPGERGAALAFVVLLVLAVLGLAHGALLASLSELAASRAAARQLRLRGAADHAVSELLSLPAAAWADHLGLWDTMSVALTEIGSTGTHGAVRRLGPEAWLLEARASAPSGVSARSRRLAWALDPTARVKALSGAVTVRPGAPVVVAGTVDAGAAAAVEAPMEPAGCEPWQPELEAHLLGSPLSIVSQLPDSGAVPGLGLLEFDHVLSLAPVLVQGSGTPAPSEGLGGCLEDDPWGWGDPSRPWRPCGAHLPMRAAPDDLVVEGGEGQGVIVVDGDLTLDAGARLYGMVLARGALRLSRGSSFVGMALAAGGLQVDQGSTLRASLCWAVRALDAQRVPLSHFRSVGGPIGPG